MTVSRIRRNALARRNALTHEQIERCGARLQERALRLIEPIAPQVVYCYLSVGQEAPTARIVPSLLKNGATVAAPCVKPGSTEMPLREVTEPRQLTTGQWGIPTPPEGAPAVDPRDVELAFVPCVAFDSRGNRIGRGGGYHDRFFAANPHILRVGLAFETQRVPAFEPQSWDEPLDAVATEAGIDLFSDRIAVNDALRRSVVTWDDAS